MEENNTSAKLMVGGVLFFIVIIILIALNPFIQIGAGERGVVMTWGKVQPEVMGEGLHLRTPIAQSVKVMSVRVQKSDVKTEGASKDLQVVTMELVVNWHINPDKVNRVYQMIGDEKEVLARIIMPAVSEMAKASTAQKNAEEIITKRPELKTDIDKRLEARLSAYGITLDDVSLVDLDFSNEFNASIEKKQVAEQNAKRAVFEAEQAKNDAVARVNKAEGESKAQALQMQSLTPELLTKMWIEKWKGDVPNTFSCGQGSFLFQVPSK